MVRARIAGLADWLVFALLALAFLVELTGGLRLGRGWYRITVTDPVRLLMVAAGLVLVRHVVLRRPSLRDRLIARRSRPSAPWTVDRPLSAASGREWLVAIAVMIGATGWLLHDQIATITGVLDRGDPFFSMWRMAWIAHQLGADPLNFWNANIFHPEVNTFAYSDATLLPGLVVAPFVWLGVPIAVLHGILYLISFVAAGLTMFALARAVTGALLPALVAGILFGFYPYRISTYSHLEMQGVFLMPLALLWLLRATEAGRISHGAALGLAVALEGLWSLYLGAYLAVGLSITALIRWSAGHFSLRARARVLTIAVLVAAAILGPYLWPYRAAREAVGDRPRDSTREFSAQPLDFLSLNEMNRLYGRALATDVNAERHLYPGSTSVVLAATALVPPITPLAAAALAGALVAADASLGVNGTTFSWLYEKMPGFHAFRVPARFGMLLGLFLALLAGMGLNRILIRWPGRVSRGLAVAFVGLAAFELRPALPLMATPTTPPAIYAALPEGGRVALVDLPLPDDDSQYWIDPTYMYYSTFHWARLLNGFSGFFPPWYPRLRVASREFPSDESIGVFRDRGAEYVAVHEEFYGPGRYRDVVTRLEGRADLSLVGVRASPAGEHRLYRLRPR